MKTLILFYLNKYLEWCMKKKSTNLTTLRVYLFRNIFLFENV